MAETPLSRYRLDPVDHFAVIRELRGTDGQIIGAYHSHVRSAATPSPTDVAEAWPEPFFYVIVSLEDEMRPDVRAYVIQNGNVIPVPITNRP